MATRSLRGGIALLLLGTACRGGCPGGLPAPDEEFPPERRLPRAARFTLTAEGTDFLAPRAEAVLRALLGEDEHGAVRLALQDLDLDELEVVDLGLVRAGVRDLVLGLWLGDVELELLPGPDRFAVRLSGATLAVREGVLSLRLLDGLGDAACGLTDGLEPETDEAHAAVLDAELDLLVAARPEGGLSVDAAIRALTLHDLALGLPVDCDLRECQDGCTECRLWCPLLEGSAEWLDGLVGGLEDAVAAALRPLLEERLDAWLAALGAEPLDLLLEPAALAGGRASSLAAAHPLRLAVAPSSAEVVPDPPGQALQVLFDPGSVAAPHPCIPRPTRAPELVPSPLPADEGGGAHLELAVASAVLDQAVWTAYEAGVFCLAVSSDDLAALAGGGAPVLAGTLDPLLPGLAALAGPDAPVLVRQELVLAPEDFPLLEVGADDGGRPRLVLPLRRAGVSLYADVDGRQTRVVGLELAGALTGSLVARPDAALEVVLDRIELTDVRLTYDEVLPGRDLEGAARFLAGALAGGLLGDGLALPLDVPAVLSEALGLPLTLDVLELSAAGPSGDWLVARVVLSDVQAAVAAAPTAVQAPARVRPGEAPHLRVPEAHAGRSLEYQARVDHLPWTSFSPGRVPDVDGPHWRLAGDHVVRVRARYAGRPRSLDVTGWRGTVRVAADTGVVRPGGCVTAGGLPRWLLFLAVGLSRRGGGALPLLAGGCEDQAAGPQPCAATAECPAGFVCSGEVCVASNPCEDATGCCPGQVCLAGLCQDPEPCSGDGDCAGPGRACSGGRCVRRACLEDAVCPPGLVCAGGRCVDRLPCDGRCGPGEACHAPTATCRAAPAACAGAACGPGELLLVQDEGEAHQGAGCGWDEAGCVCLAAPPLRPGELGRWGSLALRGEGEAVAAAWDRTFGDLVWLEFPGAGSPARELVLDGVPPGPPAAAADGYRGGVVAPGPDVGRFSSVALAADGTAWVAYRDDEAGALKVARGSGGVWSAHVVDAAGDAGWWASLALLPDGRPVVAHAAPGAPEGPELRLARATGADPADAGDWTAEVLAERPPVVVPAGGGSGARPAAVGAEISLAAAGDRLALAWLDRTGAPALWLSWSDGGGLFRHRLLAGGDGRDPGPEAALALDPTGRLLVAWTDPLHGLLLAAHGADPEALQPEPVHDGRGGGTVRPVGAWVAAAWSPGGEPVLAYQDPRDNDLWLARRTGGGAWTRQPVRTEGAVGFHNDLVVDAAGAWIYTVRLGFDVRGRSVAGPRLVRAPLP